MARMIPANPNKEDLNRSRGEYEIFKALKNGLPNDYTVFYSYLWNARNKKGRIEWGEADFTIFHPKYGLLVIEVKSGGVSLDHEGQWWYTRTDNQQKYLMKRDPLVQANRTKYSLIEELDRLNLRDDYVWVESAVWFPHISDRHMISDMPSTYEPEIVFMDWALENPKQAIDKAFNFYNSQRHTKLSKESANKIIRALAPSFDAVPSLHSIYSEQEAHFLRLTKEQSALLDFLDEQPTAVIQGSAGTGKTLLAVEKARRLSRNGKVLFLCFNRFLMEELRKTYDGENIDFYNLPSLTVKHTSTINPNDETISDFLNQYDSYSNWDYKHIIVDEGQDFNSEHIETLATIAAVQEGAFYVFYDKNQLVQRFELPKWIDNAECRLILRRNCRNTYKIATTAGSPIEVSPLLWENSIEGKSPEFHSLYNSDKLVKRIGKLVSEYKKAGIDLNQITVLTTETEERSLLKGVTKIDNWPLVYSRDKNGIFFTTARKFKGLESDVIIIIDINSKTFQAPENRNLFYVGASRAKNFLDLIACVEDNEIDEIARSLHPEQNALSSLKTIATTLKVKVTG